MCYYHLYFPFSFVRSFGLALYSWPVIGNMAPSSSPSSSDTSDLLPVDETSSRHDTTVNELTAQLVKVLQQDQSPTYLALSPSILLSLRRPVDAGPPNINDLHPYISEYHDCTGHHDDQTLQSHIYQLASNAYYYLRQTGQDQALLFHSAASVVATGQSEHRRIATRALLRLSSNHAEATSKSSRIAKQIQAAEFIIDAFGSVGGGTDSVLPLPRFGRYAELQFSESGRIVGYKSILYGLDLDTGRIGFALDGLNERQTRERTLNVLNWLVAGASNDEREYLKLHEPGTNGNTSLNGLDKERFGLLKQAFKSFGFSKKAGELFSRLIVFSDGLDECSSVASLCSTLAAILHISSLQFSPSTSSDGSTGCKVSTPDASHIIASLLGLLDNPATSASNLAKLEEAFTSKSGQIDGETCTIVLDVQKANDYKVHVAKNLYRLVWDWLGEFVNQKLEKEDFGGT